MDKRRPTFDLEAITATLGSIETLAMTSTALRDAISLGFDRTGVAAAISDYHIYGDPWREERYSED
jgi:motility quorum-sensing regulator/GCU-specific mRNA interferase toxin